MYRATTNDPAPEPEEYELGAPVATYDPGDTRDARAIEWRASCFRAVGVDELTAASLAVRRDVDRERVERMARQGATAAELRAILL